MKKERANEIFGVLLLFIGAFLLASLISHHHEDHPFFSSNPGEPVKNLTGIAGVYISHYLILTLGFSSYFVPVAFFFWAGCLFVQKVPDRKFFKFIGLMCFVISATAIFTLLTPADQKINTGGMVGYLASNFLQAYFGRLGGLILSFSCLMLSFLLATEFLLYPLFKKIWFWIYEGIQERLEERSREALEKQAAKAVKRSEKKLEFSLKGLKERMQALQTAKSVLDSKRGGKLDPKGTLHPSALEPGKIFETKSERPYIFKDVELKVKKYDPLAALGKQEPQASREKWTDKVILKKNDAQEDSKLEKKADALKEIEARERNKELGTPQASGDASSERKIQAPERAEEVSPPAIAQD
ncbi:MAG: DNA translocase FtsK 4TM domain-containing protein, partial [Candidatus Omnitrophica bacterium]|nr:DNA translocase FtsK 4TM domain-containing protein [Candidatus Omnitrophota bacterium]